MTAREVLTAFGAAGVPEAVLHDPGVFRFGDWEMEAVSAYEKQRAWSEWVRGLPKELVEARQVDGKDKACPRWLPGVFDCENHAQGSACHASVRKAVKRLRSGEPALANAAGSVWYWAAGGGPNPVTGPHCVEWLYDEAIRFFEPRLGVFMQLAAAELRRIRFVSQH